MYALGQAKNTDKLEMLKRNKMKKTPYLAAYIY